MPTTANTNVATNIDIDSDLISPDQLAQYHDEGYMILERVIPDDMLQMMREECSYLIGYIDCMMDYEKKDVLGLNHRRNRYFMTSKYNPQSRIWHFTFSELMAQITKAALGPEVYLFNEQWVVKGAEKGMKFGWHQDSGYVKHADPTTTHQPYLTCWCTLDDVCEENGSVYILPHSRAGTKDKIFDHTQENATNDLIGYTGDDPGIPVIAPAGSIVAFSSYAFHRSGSNNTDKMRRIYLGQYSTNPIRNTDGTVWSQDVHFIKDGQRVFDPHTDTFEYKTSNR